MASANQLPATPNTSSQPGHHASHASVARERSSNAAPRLPPIAHSNITGPLVSTPSVIAANISRRLRTLAPCSSSSSSPSHTVATQSANNMSKITYADNTANSGAVTSSAVARSVNAGPWRLSA